jgi:glycosyltransferase involved in cell wall biosynthesis/GNAT superfamily N-acetyltransferase
MSDQSARDVSVVIATRDRAEALAHTLLSLTRQELGEITWQIVVVDNGSVDSTAAVLDSFAGRLPLLRLHEPRAGKSRALNAARPHWRGHLLLFTDDDIEASPTWVARMVEASRRWPEANIFGGSIVPRFPYGSPDWMTDPTSPHGRWAFSTFHPRATEGPISSTPLGPNMAIRAPIMGDIEWDETLGPGLGPTVPMGEEVDLLVRLQRRGEPFIFVPDACVDHILPEAHVTLANLNVRAFRAGIDDARLYSNSVPTYPVFGIPVHLWLGLSRQVLRWLATLPAGAPRRHTAWFRVRRAMGNIRGFEDMRRAGRLGGESKAFPTVAAQLRALRRLARATRTHSRHGFGFIRSVLLFEADLGSPATSGGEAELLHGSKDLTRALRLLAAFSHQLRPEEIERRLIAGDSVSVAVEAGRTVGYAWAATHPMLMREADLDFEPGDRQVIGYDIFVHPSRRGSGIADQLDRSQMRFAERNGRSTQVVWVDAQNRASLLAMTRMSKRHVGTVHSLRVPFCRHRFVWTSGPAARARDPNGHAGTVQRPVAGTVLRRGRIISTTDDADKPDRVPPPTTKT